MSPRSICSRWFRSPSKLVAGIAILLVGLGAAAAQAAEAVPRTVLALYNSETESKLRFTRLHQQAQLPLNHLGLKVDYHDVARAGVPDAEALAGTVGIVTWFRDNQAIADQAAYARLLLKALEQGRKAVILGQPNLLASDAAKPVPAQLRERVFQRLGFRVTGGSVGVTYDTQVVRQRPAMAFERPLPAPLPRFPVVEATAAAARPYLRLRGGGQTSDVILTTPSGGYGARELVVHVDSSGDRAKRHWLVDPFRFFADALDVTGQPAPDVTTRAGRRIYYSHIDGDGWLNRTRINAYKRSDAAAPAYSSKVILEEILKQWPSYPVTVGPIAAQLDLDWHGTREARQVARDILALPNVELGSHTYSHPLAWEFFRKPGHYKRERAYFASYPGRDRLLGLMDRLRVQLGLQTQAAKLQNLKHYERPRSYGLKPFSLKREVGGSIKVIEALAPEGKRVQLYQWSGNTNPFEDAVEAVDAAGLPNINGGDTRYDPEFDSYIWVAPVGRPVGDDWQVYSANANENVYTEGWSKTYFGFQHLRQTLQNTESPRRVGAFNIYYHMYSGERAASLAALKKNLAFADQRKLIPVETSLYARIGQGFRTTRLERDERGRWHIKDRGALNTLRIGRGLDRAVDFAASRGVLGQQRLHGSLYVFLDPAAEAPVLALRDSRAVLPAAERPGYLLASEWDIRGWQGRANGFAFTARGYRDGAMRWRVAPETAYRIAIETPDGQALASLTKASNARGELALTLGPHVPGPWPKGPVRVRVTEQQPR